MEKGNDVGRSGNLMRTRILIAIAAMLLVSCNGVTHQPDAVFNYEEPVDLSDVLASYEKSQKQESQDIALPSSLDDWCEGMGYELFADTSFVIHVPQYKNSEQPFLKCAEDFYNSCALAHNLLSNVELVERELAFAGKVEESVMKIGVDFLNDEDVQESARVYGDSLIIVMRKSEEECGEDDNYTPPLVNFMRAIEEHAYKFYTSEEAFVDSLDSISKVLQKMTEKQFAAYKKSSEDLRVRIMLKQLCACENFDEQCSLLLNWADSPEAVGEEEWVVIVAERLMQSGKYNPFLFKIWLDWRCLLQSEYFGASRDSEIPNQVYNKMRKTCYLTCLKRIETNSDDEFAMNCAAVLAGRVNILRVGHFMFGNDAIADMHDCMPNRYPVSSEYEDDDDEETGEYWNDSLEVWMDKDGNVLE